MAGQPNDPSDELQEHPTNSPPNDDAQGSPYDFFTGPPTKRWEPTPPPAPRKPTLPTPSGGLPPPPPSGDDEKLTFGGGVALAVFLLVVVFLLRGCWGMVSESQRMSDYCSSAATTVVDMFGGDRSDWRAVYNECTNDPREPWDRGR